MSSLNPIFLVGIEEALSSLNPIFFTEEALCRLTEIEEAPLDLKPLFLTEIYPPDLEPLFLTEIYPSDLEPLFLTEIDPSDLEPLFLTKTKKSNLLEHPGSASLFHCLFCQFCCSSASETMMRITENIIDWIYTVFELKLKNNLKIVFFSRPFNKDFLVKISHLTRIKGLNTD